MDIKVANILHNQLPSFLPVNTLYAIFTYIWSSYPISNTDHKSHWFLKQLSVCVLGDRGFCRAGESGVLTAPYTWSCVGGWQFWPLAPDCSSRCLLSPRARNTQRNKISYKVDKNMQHIPITVKKKYIIQSRCVSKQTFAVTDDRGTLLSVYKCMQL